MYFNPHLMDLGLNSNSGQHPKTHQRQIVENKISDVDNIRPKERKSYIGWSGLAPLVLEIGQLDRIQK